MKLYLFAEGRTEETFADSPQTAPRASWPLLNRIVLVAHDEEKRKITEEVAATTRR